MDKKQGLKLLKEALDRSASLKEPTTHYSEFHKEFYGWRNEVLYILEDTFSKDSPEYTRFSDAVRPVRYGSDQEQYKSDINNLDKYELVLRSIIRNQEDISTSETATVIQALNETAAEPPKAFIAHGGKTPARDKLEQYIRALDITPLIVEDQPTENKAVDDKVEHYLEQADCVIILATADDKVGEKLQPRLNVIHEIGLAQKTFHTRIIYLLEEGAEFPSNIKPKVWESFTQECMDKAFVAVARELNAFRLLKSVKPST